MEPVGVLLKHSGVLNWSSAKSLKIASFCWNILKKVWKDRSKKLFLPGLDFFCCLGYWMLFDSFDSSCSSGNVQKYLKIYCELWRQITQSFLPVGVVFSLKTRARWKIHLFTSQLNLPKFGKRQLFFMNYVENLRKGLLTIY